MVQGRHPSLSLLHGVRVHHERLGVSDDLEGVDSCGEVGDPRLGDEDHPTPRPQVPLLGEVRDDVILQDEPPSLPLHAALSVRGEVISNIDVHIKCKYCCRAVVW